MQPPLHESQVTDSMEELFGPDAKTAPSRLLLTICKLTGIIAIGSPVIGLLANSLHGVALSIIWSIFVVSVIGFIASLCLLSIRSLGMEAGKQGLGRQFVYALSRVTLYIFLPCIVITLLLVIWAIATKQPAFTNTI